MKHLRTIGTVLLGTALGAGSQTQYFEPIEQGDLHAVRVLIEQEVPLHPASGTLFSRFGPGLSPLHVAVLCDKPRIARLLLEHGADPNAMASRTGQEIPDFTHGDAGVTPLHLAAIAGRTNLIDILLTGGARINASSAHGLKPLDLIYIRHPPDPKSMAVHLQSRGATADVFTAVCRGDAVGLKRLLDQEPALLQSTNAAGATPLELAALFLLAPSVHVLLPRGVNVMAPSVATGNSILETTIRQAWCHIPGTFRVCNPDFAGDPTPLTNTILPMIEGLLNIPTTAEARRDTLTHLWWATLMTRRMLLFRRVAETRIGDAYLKIADILAQGGADINTCGDMAVPMLHIVFWDKDLSGLRLLLKHRPDLAIRDPRNGKTALEYADSAEFHRQVRECFSELGVPYPER